MLQQKHPPFILKTPEEKTSRQGDETFIVSYNGEEKKFRSHDYHEIYAVPGLYEHLFYDTYKCNSPEVVCSLLNENLSKNDADPSDLTVLDVGAGNGMVGEKLLEIGVNSVVGIDIIPEAQEALNRDRPGIYDQYYVEDLTRLSPDVHQEIESFSPNCLTIVAALGFDDIPPQAFSEAYNMISESGWIAFNIKEEFCCDSDCTGFASLIEKITDANIMEIKSKERYCHRFCQDGSPLHYNAIVAEKHEDIATSIVESI